MKAKPAQQMQVILIQGPHFQQAQQNAFVAANRMIRTKLQNAGKITAAGVQGA